jgi:two-component system, NtrC family, sensor histidine kinase HydH
MTSSRFPIRYLLLGAFLLTSLLPTTLVTGLAFYEARTALKTEIQHDLETRAYATADDIDRMLFERLQNIASWSKLEVMQDIRFGDVDKRLSTFLRELNTSYQGMYQSLYVIDQHQRVIASSHRDDLSSVKSSFPIWREFKFGQSTITMNRPQESTLILATEILDPENTNNIGWLVAEFNWQEITDILNNAVSGRTSAAILDESSSLLASTRHWQNTTKARISAKATIDGFQQFSGSQWKVVFSQHRDEALAPIRRMGLIFIGLLVATLLLASFIAIPVARSISGPLRRLTDFANQFIRAPSDLRPPRGGPAEIDELSQAFSRMIEDLERSRAHLTRAAKLAVVGEMAAAMSHEVRTPLGILRSSAQVLLREPELSKEGKEVCGFIISETDRLNKLVTTLIDTARPRPPEFTLVNLNELAEQAVAMLRVQAEKKGIQLESKTENHVMSRCDREQILQVLLNLLLNAIQILPEQGHVTIRVGMSGNLAEIRVEDNGPGIPPEQREQVFDPFFTQRAGGIGLGLAVVRQIVSAHHGEITVGESSMKGAEFRLLLPASEETS